MQALPWIFRLFWIQVPPKNPYLNQATQKNNFLPENYQEMENFKPQKILRSSLSLEIQSTFLDMTPGYFYKKQKENKTKRTFYSLRKQPTFGDATTGFLAK